MTAKNFYNFSDQDFTYTFDSVPYTFKAGTSMYMEDYKAFHFAKHLVDRELNKLDIPTNNATRRLELEKKCFPTDEVVTPMEALNIEEKNKAKKTKKVEEEFADLNN